MSQDLRDAKKLTGSVFPEAVYDASNGLKRVEPMLTAEVLKERFLFGIPLYSPITRQKLTDAMLSDYIIRAANQVEVDGRIEISPVAKRVRLPFDPNLYENFIWIECPYKPVQKIIRLFIASASYVNTPQEHDQYPSGAQIYVIPNDWVDPSYAVKGKIFVNPLNPAFAAIGTAQSAASAGAAILQFIGMQGWVPAYWSLEVITGFCSENGQVPNYINEAIGQKAAILVLENLFLLFRFTSRSLGIDGMSQSVADQFPQFIQARIQMLNVEYAKSIKQIKSLVGNTSFVSNV
jgi:hypothetical protein